MKKSTNSKATATRAKTISRKATKATAPRTTATRAKATKAKVTRAKVAKPLPQPLPDVHLVKSNTPWGQAQSAEDIAPGITLYSTASHGGYFLNGTTNARVSPILKRSSFNAQGFDGWYEEDCDWAIVVYTFPQYFSQEKYKRALESLATHHSAAYKSLVALHQ